MVFFFCLKNIKFDLLKRSQFVVIFLFLSTSAVFIKEVFYYLLRVLLARSSQKINNFMIRSSFRIFFSLISRREYVGSSWKKIKGLITAQEETEFKGSTSPDKSLIIDLNNHPIYWTKTKRKWVKKSLHLILVQLVNERPSALDVHLSVIVSRIEYIQMFIFPVMSVLAAPQITHQPTKANCVLFIFFSEKPHGTS